MSDFHILMQNIKEQCYTCRPVQKWLWWRSQVPLFLLLGCRMAHNLTMHFDQAAKYDGTYHFCNDFFYTYLLHRCCFPLKEPCNNLRWNWGCSICVLMESNTLVNEANKEVSSKEKVITVDYLSARSRCGIFCLPDQDVEFWGLLCNGEPTKCAQKMRVVMISTIATGVVVVFLSLPQDNFPTLAMPSQNNFPTLAMPSQDSFPTLAMPP